MYTIGDSVEVTVINISDFGAFVVDDKDTKGLIHISEVSNYYVDDINDHFKIGDQLDVQILNFDEARGQLKLSYKAINDSVKIKRNFEKESEFTPVTDLRDATIIATKDRLGIND